MSTDTMSMSATRIGAVIRKELAEFRRNRFILVTASILPLIFLISPTAQILAIKASAVSTVLQRRVETGLFLPLLIPVFVPSILSAYAVVGEREQGTLEPVLTTPISRVEFLLGKAAAIFVPAIGVSYLIFGVFVAITQFAAQPHGGYGRAARAPAARRADLYPAPGRLGDLGRPGHLRAILRHPRRPAAQYPGQLAAGRGGRAHVVRRDKPDAHRGRRVRGRSPGHRLPGLLRRSPGVRP